MSILTLLTRPPGHPSSEGSNHHSTSENKNHQRRVSRERKLDHIISLAEWLSKTTTHSDILQILTSMMIRKNQHLTEFTTLSSTFAPDFAPYQIHYLFTLQLHAQTNQRLRRIEKALIALYDNVIRSKKKKKSAKKFADSKALSKKNTANLSFSKKTSESDIFAAKNIFPSENGQDVIETTTLSSISPTQMDYILT